MDQSEKDKQRTVTINQVGYRLAGDRKDGGCGVVYQAVRQQDNCEVAIKIVPCKANDLREIEILRNLHDENVVKLYDSADCEELDGRKLYLVMEYIAGEDLKTYCSRKENRDLKIKLGLLIAVAQTVDRLHNLQPQGVIHRDLKPANIMVTASGKPYILDFGVSRLLESGRTDASCPTLYVGTPQYMSPEQVATCGNITGQCDVWALGVILYELLEEQLPFIGTDVISTANQILKEPVAWEKCRDQELQRIGNKALSKETEKRYQSAKELAQDISRYLRRACGGKRSWRGWSRVSYRTYAKRLPECRSIPEPLAVPELLVFGGSGWPAEVWLAYPVVGKKIGKIRKRTTSEAIQLAQATGQAIRHLEAKGLTPGLPRLEDYCEEDGRAWLLADAWCLQPQQSSRQALQLYEMLSRVVAEGEQDEWKKQKPKSEESVEKWLERLDKEEAGLRRLGELEAELAAMSGEEAEQLCRELLGYYWGLDRLRRPAEKLVRKLREGEGEMAVRLHFGEPEGEVLASWEQSNRAGERRRVWLTQRVASGKSGGGRKVQAGSMPSGWSEELWKECWDEDWRLMDFTTKAWQECKHRKHWELSRAYQQWYAERLGFAGPQKKERGKFQGGESELELMLVPPGRFMMGSPGGEKGHQSDEQQHLVTLSQGYWLGRTALSQEQWQAIAGSRPWDGEKYAGKEATAAANYISDAAVDNELLPKLQLVLGGEYRIPSEAEWEHACRAGTLTRFYWGEDESEQEIGKYAWYSGNCQGAYPQPVGVKPANAWGLCDMSGNIYEMCKDVYERNYGLAKLKQDKKAGFVDPVSTTGSRRVCRGGDWGDGPVRCRCAFRDRWWLDGGGLGVGVRVQQVIPPC